jgi:multiple sugar transport system substrate-binding protein
MKRPRVLMAVMCAALVVAAACTAGGEDEEPQTLDRDAENQEPVTIEIWGAWTGRELRQFNKIFDGFTEEYPWITVDSRGGVGDDQIIAAINSGKPPDVVLSFSLDSVGKFCSTGAWVDLKSYMEEDNFDSSQFPEAATRYTTFDGKQCALPFLTDAYGLYYNNDLFEKAGLSEPPRTMSELTEYTEKLTEFNPDGSIKVAGFVPWFGYYQSVVLNLSTPWGVRWYNEDGTETAIATDPQWVEMFEWQKDLVDFYGSENLNKFVAGQGEEFSSANDFQKGRTAMAIDGEWRTAFIADGAPNLTYSTAPFPVPDDRADTYGFGQVGGTIIGMPRGSPHPAEAWELLKFMSTDTDTLVYMANNVRNVPTTFEALESPELDVTPQFQTFLDIFENPQSHSKETSAIGSADQDLLGNFAERWQTGRVDDLQAGLAEVAEQINNQLEQAAR